MKPKKIAHGTRIREVPAILSMVFWISHSHRGEYRIRISFPSSPNIPLLCLIYLCCPNEAACALNWFLTTGVPAYTLSKYVFQNISFTYWKIGWVKFMWKFLVRTFLSFFLSFVDPGSPVVIILTTGSEDPDLCRWIFSERKNPEYDFLRKGCKAVGPMP